MGPPSVAAAGSLSVAAGCLQAAAAALGKLAGQQGLHLALRPALLAGHFGTNVYGMSLYVRSMARLASLQATTYSTTSQILATGLLGRLLFGEAVGWRWLLGALCLLLGVLLSICKAPSAAAALSSSAAAGPPRRAVAAACSGSDRASNGAAGGGGAVHHAPADSPAGAGTGAAGSGPAAQAAPLSVAAGVLASGGERNDGLGHLGTLSYRLVLAYDGTDYCGWQLQPRGLPTVQARLEKALTVALREDRAVLGVRAAGRTDSGVHARGQVVQFSSNRDMDTAKLPYKLNSLLPHDVRVLSVSRTAPDFSVTCSAMGKIYHYRITNTETHDPLTHRYSHHVRKPLDVELMRRGAALLLGTHDFTQFSNIGEEGAPSATNRKRRNPVKTLRRVDVVEGGEPGALRIEVEGDGFLYKMVRHISGALLALGEGRLPLEALSRMLDVGGSAPPGQYGSHRGYNVAPAKGLTLHTVFYDPRVDDPSTLLYPQLAHDEYGRLLEGIPGARSDEE